MSEFLNSWEDAKRAEAYAKLDFPGTYYLIYRDLPKIVLNCVGEGGRKALDFGCGAGRSARFLKNLGFDVVGADISADMLKKAKEKDPDGDYRLVQDGNLRQFEDETFNLIQSIFPFDNIPTMELKVKIFSELKRILKNDGKIINLVSSPEIYTHEWASFSTKDFQENKLAKSGDKVKIIITDVEDQRPVEDIFWTPKCYKKTYEKAGLKIVKIFQPLGNENEPFNWVNETRIAPWHIYVLEKNPDKP